MESVVDRRESPAPATAPPRETPPAAEAAPSKPRARKPFAILGAVLAVVLLAISIYWLATRNREDTDDAQIAADVVPIGTRAAGQVVRVLVDENQLVKKGAVIAEIDDADYAARVESAEAELATAQAQAAAADAQAQVIEATSKGGLASARANYSGSSVGVTTAEAQVAVARAAVVRAEADAHKTELDLGRTRELRAANAVTQERLDNAQIANDSAQAALGVAKAQLTAAEDGRRAAAARVGEAEGRVMENGPIASRITAARANADLAHAHVKSAQAQLRLAQLQLSYTKVTVPADGVASKLTVHEGQLVQIGQPVIQLVPVATYVIANFKETQIGKMKPGQEVEISVDAFPTHKLRGRVESISGGTGASFSLLPADNASGNFVKVVQRVPVRIAWVDAPRDLALRAGMSADVVVYVK